MDPASRQPYSEGEIAELVGPVALYVDDLLAVVLPASAHPLQVVEAARFLEARQSDPTLQPEEDWDEAIVALLNYPEVLQKMNADLRWTAALGEAFAYQPAEVLDAIQRFREQARYLGSLESDSYQTVTESAGGIAIAPTDPQVVYVPSYEPAQVLSYGSQSSLAYSGLGYPVYDYPYPAGYSFGSGFWGVTTAYVVRWNARRVYVYPQGSAEHPYYRYRYHDPYYARRWARVRVAQDGDHDVWRPGERWREPRDQHRDPHHDHDRDRDERVPGAYGSGYGVAPRIVVTSRSRAPVESGAPSRITVKAVSPAERPNVRRPVAATPPPAGASPPRPAGSAAARAAGRSASSGAAATRHEAPAREAARPSGRRTEVTR
jgi:hypothetical protein